MAKEVNKRINIWINGQQVENNLKSIKAAILKTTNELNKMTIGSDEYVAHSRKLKELKEVYEEHVKVLKLTTNETEKLGKAYDDSILKGGALATITGTGIIAFKKFIDKSQEYVDAYATIDDAMTAVTKYTGLSRDEVKSLNEELQKIDTRTPIEKLNALASDAGRLGITSKEAVLDFVEAADIINVALGEDLGEDAVKNIGKMAQMFGETDKLGLRGAMIATASAINELAQSSSASEGYIMEVASRLAGVANSAGISQANIMGLASALDQNMMQAEKSATAMQKFIMSITSQTDKYAQLVGMTSDEFSRMVSSDINAVIVKILESFNKLNDAGGIDELSKAFSDLHLSGSGIQEVLMSLSKHTDQIRVAQESATEAYKNGTSVLNEYNTANNNAAAELEKQRNQINILKAELGEKIYPLYQKLIASVLALSNGTLNLVEKLKNHKEIIVIIAGLLLKQIGHYTVLAYKKAINTAATIKDTIATKANTVATNLSTIKLYLHCAAHDIAAKKITLHTAAVEALNVVWKKTPWGAVIAAALALGTAIYKLATRTTEAEAAMKEFNERAAKEQSEARYLFDQLKKTEEGTDEYKEALQRLIDKYPEVMAKHIDEKGKLDDINKAYQDVINSIKSKIAMELKEKAITDATTKAIETQQQALDKMRDKLVSKKGMSETQASDISKQILSLAQSGESAFNIWYKVSNGGELFDSTEFSGFFQTFGTYIADVVKAESELKQKTDEVSMSFDGFIQQGETATDKVAELKSEIEKLRNMRRGAEDKKSIDEQIKSLEKQIELEEEKKKVQSSESDIASTGGSSDEKLENKIKKFNEKLQEFRNKQRIDQLNDWEKTKAQIVSQYDEMIADAEKYYGKESQLAKDLEQEKGDAIISAGQKYLKKYGDAINDFVEKTAEMSGELDGEDGSALMNDILGSNKKWDEHIASIVSNIETLKSVVGSMGENDEDRHIFESQILAMQNALSDVQIKKIESTSAIIRKYAGETNDFIASEQKRISDSTKSEYQKEVEAVEKRYNDEIEKIKELIEARKKLLGNDGAGDAEIESMNQQISTLNGLLEESKNTLTESSGSTWINQLMDFDWKNFKDNWQQGLNVAAGALQEFGSAAMNIIGSINDIQSNREQQELNEFKAAQDAKAEALQKRLDAGLISQEQYDASIEQLNAETEAKEKEIELEQFRREKRMAIVNAIISGAVAIMQGFAQAGPIGGAILAALQAAMTAAQIAVISSQPEPYAKGGYIDRKKFIVAGEAGREWIASNQLLTDPETAPIIDALQQYQDGKRMALRGVSVPSASVESMYQSGKNNSRTFASSNSDNELLNEMKKMNKYLMDPKNRQAVISRKLQLEYDKNESEIKQLARL